MSTKRRWTPPKLDYQATPDHPTVPSWIVSICLHGTLMFCFAAGLQSCERGQSGASDENFRDVGIYVKNAAEELEPNPAEETPESAAAEVSPANTETVPTDAQLADAAAESLNSLPSDLVSLPELDIPSVIGAGQSLSMPAPATAANVLESINGAPVATSTQSTKHGETSFFDIKASGTRFVYVVDCSSSMGFYKQLLVAKSEVVASLQSLDSTQQFQVIFYNSSYREMSLSNLAPSLWWATDIRKNQARQYLSSIGPEGGTSHMPALKRALSYSPENIFLLTDAEQPIMSAAELNEIKSINRGRTAIHTVEFGRGGNLDVDNFLKKLARENGGSYRYRDVTKFGRD
ncbi:MAG: hypothetical protein HQ518_19565 [Rhodopirellula sp.]|nr:hypothetical protein [Rhodopirellula sp.]